MVHKRYVYRNGKKYGPYLYENSRVDGKVVSKFLGKVGKLSSLKNANLIFFGFLLFFMFSFVNAASVSNFSGQGVSDDTVGSLAWSNPGNIGANDSSYATEASGNGVTEYLQGTNFSFSIPAGATIDGIEVVIERADQAQGGMDADDNSVRLRNGTAYKGDNKEQDTTWPDSDGAVTYGGSSDLWGTTWSVDEINADLFGVGISAEKVYLGGPPSTIRVDYQRITVYYTESSSDDSSPEISFETPTPSDYHATTNTSFDINVSIIEENMNDLRYNWNGSDYNIYNDSLVLMMNFDDYTRLNDTSNYTNHGSCDSCPTFTSNGRYNGAYSFNGIDQNITIASPPPPELLFGAGNWTLSAWINKTESSTGNSHHIVGQGKGGGGGIRYYMSVDSAGFPFVTIDDNTALQNSNAYSVNVSDSLWHHITAQRQDNLLNIYVDGILRNSTDIGSYGSLDSSDAFVIGSEFRSNNWFNGTIDEVRAWNRSLSAEEVYIDYASNLRKQNASLWYLSVNQSQNATTGLAIANYTYYVNATDASGNNNQTETRVINITAVADTTNPGVTINFPTNVTYSISDLSLEFNVTLSENGSVSYSFDSGVTNVSMTGSEGSAFGINFNSTNSSLASGSYTFQVYANDTSGNDNNTESVVFSFDGENPIVNLQGLANGSSVTNESVSFNVTFSDNIALSNSTFFLWNSTGALITSNVNGTISGTVDSINFTYALPREDTYFWNYLANDTSGNSAFNSTNWTVIYTDGSNPALGSLVEDPSDPATYSSGALYMFNATVTDSNLDAVLLEFGGTNYTTNNVAGNVYNLTLTDLAAGVYSYVWRANDTYGNVNTTAGTYTINNATGHVAIAINGTEGNQTITYGSQTNVSANTSYGSLTLLRSGSSVSSENHVFVTLGVGDYNYTAQSSGDQNHSSVSLERFVHVVRAASEVNLTLNNTEGNDSIGTGQSIVLNGTLVTGDSGATLRLYNNGTLINVGSGEVSNLTTFTVAGSYNITVEYVQSQNYTKSVETYYVNVTTLPDTENPGVNLGSPSNGTTVNDDSVSFEATLTDNIAISNATFFLWNQTGSVINTTLNGTVSGTSASIIRTISLPDYGTYFWNYLANDTSGNSAFNSTNWTLVYSAAPQQEEEESSSSSGGGSGGGGNLIVKPQSIESVQIVQGYTRGLRRDQGILFEIRNPNGTVEVHEFRVKKVLFDRAEVVLLSDPYQTTLFVGDLERYDLNNDGFYDLSVKVNSIVEGQGTFTLKAIYEPIEVESSGIKGEERPLQEEIKQESGELSLTEKAYRSYVGFVDYLGELTALNSKVILSILLFFGLLVLVGAISLIVIIVHKVREHNS